MINLIPPEALKEVKKEYWIRVFSVWAVLVGFAFLIIAILHVPVYHLLGTQKDSYQKAYTTANEQTEEFNIAEDSIKNANAVATLLTKKNEQTPFSYVIATIDSLVPRGVVVGSYSLTRKDGGLSTIAISGVATGRSTLTSFKNAIENNPLFKVASIPLSDLTKDKDIPFTLTITPHATSTKL